MFTLVNQDGEECDQKDRQNGGAHCDRRVETLARSSERRSVVCQNEQRRDTEEIRCRVDLTDGPGLSRDLNITARGVECITVRLHV